jgi:thiazole synthase ThiGH ThiG subunit
MSTVRNASRALILRVAAAAEADPRTVARALRDGVDTVRIATLRDRIERALAAEQPAHDVLGRLGRRRAS